LGNFDVVGLSVTTPAFSHAAELMSAVRNSGKFTGTIIAGGHHPTFCPEEVLRAGADIAVRGEGDVIFPLVLEALARGQPSATLSEVPGISFCDVSGEIQHSAAAGLIPDLASVPHPAWDLFRYAAYSPMSVITSRGCPYRCGYCGAAAFWQHSTRMRPVPDVINELDALLQLYPYTNIKFQDSVFTLNKRRTLDLLQAIADRQYPLRWICETRADALDAEVVRLMLAAGCKTIMLGVESGSQAVLNENDRHLDPHQLVDVCHLIRSRGIGLRVSVIFGLPGETRDTVEETIILLRDIKANVTFLNLATAYPGCPLARHATASFEESWLKSFGGHGVGGRLVLPEGMKSQEYRHLVDHLQQEIRILNRLHWEPNKKRQ
jgi:radical SAM superfamily enzyme YgiQ (UPF0313 family)